MLPTNESPAHDSPDPTDVMEELFADDPYGEKLWEPDELTGSTILVNGDLEQQAQEIRVVTSEALDEARARDDRKGEEATNIKTEIVWGGNTTESGMTPNDVADRFASRHMLVDKSQEVADALIDDIAGFKEKWRMVYEMLVTSGIFFNVEELIEADNGDGDSVDDRRNVKKVMERRVMSKDWIFAQASGNIEGRDSGFVSGVVAQLPRIGVKKPLMPVPNPDADHEGYVFQPIQDLKMAEQIARDIIAKPWIACLADELAVYPERYRRHRLGLAALNALAGAIADEVNPRIPDPEDRIQWMIGSTYRFLGLRFPRAQRMKKPKECPALNLPSLLMETRRDVGGIISWQSECGPNKEAIVDTRYFKGGVINEKVILALGWDYTAMPVRQN